MQPTDPPTFPPTRTLKGHAKRTRYCAITPDGTVALSSSSDKTARVWDLADLAGDATTGPVLNGHCGTVWQCALSADGAIAATASQDGSARVWDAATGEQLYVLRRDSMRNAYGCALSADGNLLVATFYSTDQNAGQLLVCNWRQDQTVTEINRSYALFSTAVSQDADTIAFVLGKPGSDNLGVEVVDRSGRVLRAISCSGSSSVAMAYAGSATTNRYVTIANGMHLRVYEVLGNEEPFEMEGYQCGAYRYCALTPSGSHVVATTADHSYCVWDRSTGAIVATLRGPPVPTRGCAISADGVRIVTCSEDNSVRVWLAPTTPSFQ